MRQGQTKVGRKQQNKRETGTQRGTRELFRVRRVGKPLGGERKDRERGAKRETTRQGGGGHEKGERVEE